MLQFIFETGWSILKIEEFTDHFVIKLHRETRHGEAPRVEKIYVPLSYRDILPQAGEEFVLNFWPARCFEEFKKENGIEENK